MAVATPCRFWQDHDFEARRFLDAGRHEVLGEWQRFVTRCRLCQKEIVEREWTSRKAGTIRMASYGG